MTPPPGLVRPPHHVCRLKRALYGLKQAPRAWFNCFKSSILSIGFRQSAYDSTLFTRCTDKGFVFLLLFIYMKETDSNWGISPDLFNWFWLLIYLDPLPRPPPRFSLPTSLCIPTLIHHHISNASFSNTSVNSVSYKLGIECPLYYFHCY